MCPRRRVAVGALARSAPERPRQGPQQPGTRPRRQRPRLTFSGAGEEADAPGRGRCVGGGRRLFGGRAEDPAEAHAARGPRGRLLVGEREHGFGGAGAGLGPHGRGHGAGGPVLWASGEEPLGGAARAGGAVHLQRRANGWGHSGLGHSDRRPAHAHRYRMCPSPGPRSPSGSWEPCLRKSPERVYKQKGPPAAPDLAPPPRGAALLSRTSSPRGRSGPGALPAGPGAGKGCVLSPSLLWHRNPAGADGAGRT